MATIRSLDRSSAMASQWRRRRMCMLLAERAAPAGLRRISASGAFLETDLRPPLGEEVELRHPEAGTIRAQVGSHARDGVSVSFHYGDEAVAFALAAIAADMSRP